MRTVGEGTIKKLVFLAVVVGGAIGIGTWYGPFAQGYELKNAAKIACNGAIKELRAPPEAPKEFWEEAFLRRATQVGVKLKPNQYRINAVRSKTSQESICTAKIVYRASAEWVLIGDVFAIEPMTLEKRIDFEHRVPDAFQ